ncbi:MAG: hypothetical protein MRY83_23965 [Flavobacteriales bacterium]|nr:hypothetical protein [Flavobacteriales bacterium]
MKLENKDTILIKLSLICVIIAYLVQGLCWEFPFLDVFWNKHFFGHFTNDWEQYIRSEIPHSLHKNLSIGFILILLITGITVFTNRLVQMLKIMFIILLILSMLKFYENGFRIGIFLEYGIQFTLPLLLYYQLKTKFTKTKTIALMAIAITFLGHGLFAISYYPQPGTFLDMFSNILGLNEANSKRMLILFGFLDIVLLPSLIWKKTRKYSIYYFILWGFLTAFARLWANFGIYSHSDFVIQWFWQFLVRLPHGLIPLYILINDKASKDSDHILKLDYSNQIA